MLVKAITFRFVRVISMKIYIYVYRMMLVAR